MVSFFYIEDHIVFIGVISSAFALLITKLTKIFNIHLRINKEFGRFAKFNILRGLMVSVSIIVSISYIGIYAPLIVGVISSAIVFFIMYKKININLTFLLEKTEILRQLRMGVALGGLTLTYGLGMYLERYIVVEKFGLEGVGYFAFSMFFVMFFQYFIYDLVRPYMPIVKEELANKNFDILKKSVVHPTLRLAPIAIVLVLALQTVFPVIVDMYFPQYIQAIEVFKTTVWLILPISLSSFSGYLLYSKGINKIPYAYFSHLIYIGGISLFFFMMDINNLVEIVGLFLIFSMAKSLFQIYHVLNILYSRFLLVAIFLLIEVGFVWLLQ